MENQELIKQVTEKAEKWLTPAYDAETQAEVKRMLENPDKTELIECFYKDLEFGTGGLRGIMGAGDVYKRQEFHKLATMLIHLPFITAMRGYSVSSM